MRKNEVANNLIKPILASLLIWIALTFIILLYDFIQINFPSLRVTVFDLLIYNNGVSVVVVGLIFFAVLKERSSFKLPLLVITSGIISIFWHAFNFLILMYGLHSMLGGFY